MKAVFNNFYSGGSNSAYKQEELNEKSYRDTSEGKTQDIKVASNLAFPQSADIEHIQTRPSTSQSETSSQFSDALKKKMSRFSNFIMRRDTGMTEEQKQLEEEGLSIFNKCSDKKNYIASFVAYFVAGLTLLMAVVNLPFVIISPYKFTIFFTISMVSTLTGLAFMNGPRTYLKKLTIKKHRIQTGVLLISIMLSLYFSLISESYILSLLFSFIQLNAVVLFFFNTFPFGWNAVKSTFNGAKAIVQSQLPQ